MTVDRWVALNINDENGYQAYRDGMTPILAQYGGAFIVDVRVNEVLSAPEDASFNRLFLIRFPSIESLEAFFSDLSYVTVREAHFENSVAETYFLGRYDSDR